MKALALAQLYDGDEVVQKYRVALEKASDRSRKATLRVVRIYFRVQVRKLIEKIDERMGLLVSAIKEGV